MVRVTLTIEAEHTWRCPECTRGATWAISAQDRHVWGNDLYEFVRMHNRATGHASVLCERSILVAPYPDQAHFEFGNLQKDYGLASPEIRTWWWAARDRLNDS